MHFIQQNINVPLKLENLIWTHFLIKNVGVETWVYQKDRKTPPVLSGYYYNRM